MSQFHNPNSDNKIRTLSKSETPLISTTGGRFPRALISLRRLRLAGSYLSFHPAGVAAFRSNQLIKISYLRTLFQ